MNYYRNENYYDILGVSKNSSLDNIQKAKDRLKFGGPEDKVPFSMWGKIDEAYTVLSDPEKRREYDKKLEEKLIDNSTPDLKSDFIDLQSKIKENKEKINESSQIIEKPMIKKTDIKPIIDQEEKIIETEIKSEQLSEENENEFKSNLESSFIDLQSKIRENKEKIDESSRIIEKSTVEKIDVESIINPEEKIINLENKNVQQQEVNLSESVTNQYVSEFKPIETEKIKNEEKLKTIGKETIKYGGGALAGAVLFGPAAAIPGVIIGFAAVKLLDKNVFKIIKEEINYRKISRISTEEMRITAEYYKKLDDSINRLLSEPHNNYKLKVLELKYKNQTELLEKLLEAKLNRKYKTRELFKQKIDLVSTKMQLDTAKRNLEDITEQIKDYENYHKKSKKQEFIDLTKQKIEDFNENLENHENKKNASDISRVFAGIARENLESITGKIEKHETMKSLSKMNKELININKKISEDDKNQINSSDVKSLQIYKSNLLQERNIKASNLKAKVVRTRSVYDKFLRAKDFMASLPYIVKPLEQVAEFVEVGNQKLR